MNSFAELPGRPFPRLIFNCDGDSTTLSHFTPPITPKQFCRAVDELENTRVDTFIYCMNRGDDTFSHRTKIGEIYGEHVSEWRVPAQYRRDPQADQWQKVVDVLKRIADNTRSLLDAGHDPMEILAARTHELGLAFWAGLRMNDIHEDDTRRFFPLRSTFKQTHPELLIGSPYPNPDEGYAQDNFTWAFDFARKEVCERKLAIIEEACLNYDLDGFELDFQRGPWYFKTGMEQAGMPLMTDFLRSVRNTTARIAREKKKNFILAVRVPPSFTGAERKGLDVRAWIKENLADLVIPMDAGYMDLSVDIREYTEAVKGTSCKIAGGIEPYTKDSGRANSQIFRAVASALYRQGCHALYLFNFDCHRSKGRENPYTDWELDLLRTLDNPPDGTPTV